MACSTQISAACFCCRVCFSAACSMKRRNVRATRQVISSCLLFRPVLRYVLRIEKASECPKSLEQQDLVNMCYKAYIHAVYKNACVMSQKEVPSMFHLFITVHHLLAGPFSQKPRFPRELIDFFGKRRPWPQRSEW